MIYRVEIRASAQRDIARFPSREQKRITTKISALAENPRPSGCVKLTALDNLWRIRVGDYRVVYSIHDQELIVLIVHVAHRREVYRGL
jgi:mRNA interferase RelE/StbE